MMMEVTASQETDTLGLKRQHLEMVLTGISGL